MDALVNFGKINLLLLLSMLPSIIIGFIVYKKDVVEKEPLKLLIKLFFMGALSTGIALLFEIYFDKLFSFISDKQYLYIIIKSFVVVALSEEATKWFFTYVICFKKSEFNYTYDAIVYSVFMSLGFATVENVFAILSSGENVGIALQRGIITVPLHAFLAILSGYYLGNAKKYLNRGWKKKKKKCLMLSFVMPVLIHGLFDCLLFFENNITSMIALLLVAYLYYSSFLKVIKVSKERKKITRE